MIELRIVEHVLALGRFRNFARAAEALGLTQPSLSRSIAALERELGVPLFDRGQKGVTPTAFGELLLERGGELLGREADLRRDLMLLGKVEIGTLAIGAGPYPTEISIGTAVARLARLHPGLRISVTTADPDEIGRKVLGRELDLGVVNPLTFGDTSRLEVEPLPPHNVYLGCRPGHPLTALPELTLGTVLQYPLTSTLFAGEAAQAAAAHEGAGTVDRGTGNFVPAIHVNSLSVARQVARESDALFPGTASMLAPDLESGRLVRLPFHIPAMRTSHAIVTLRGRTQSPAACVFTEILREVEMQASRLGTGEALG